MMSREYTSNRKRVVESLVVQLKTIDGSGDFLTDISENVYPTLRFWDEVTQFPEIHVTAGSETFEYLPGNFKWRFLTITVRVYVDDGNDPQEALALLLQDIETVLESSGTISYTDYSGATKSISEITILSLSTDEGVLSPLGAGELVAEIRY